MGYVVGVGVRPEKVADAEALPGSLRKAAVRFGAALGMIVKTGRLFRAAYCSRAS